MSFCLVRERFPQDLLLRDRVLVRISNVKVSRLRFACVKDCTKERNACASRLFFLNQPIVSLIFDVAVSIVAVVFKLPVNDEQNESLFYSVFVSLTG